MTTATDITALSTAIALVADANTKAALNDVVTVINDLLTALNANTATDVTQGAAISVLQTAVAANPYIPISTVGGIMPTPFNSAPTPGVATLDLATYVSVPGRVTAAVTQNLPLINFSVSSFTLTAGTHNVAYTKTLTATGGSSNGFSFVVVDPTKLPAGLALSTAGVLSGTPTTAGAYVFAVTVTDSASNAVSAAFSIQIN